MPPDDHSKAQAAQGKKQPRKNLHKKKQWKDRAPVLSAYSLKDEPEAIQ
jgi:hypothetical protein